MTEINYKSNMNFCFSLKEKVSSLLLLFVFFSLLSTYM